MTKELTAGQITKYAMTLLEARQCFVWRSNNLPVPGRKFTGLKGVPDICGFHKRTGVAVYCEVKTINDKFSEYQLNFMQRASKAGSHCMVATEEKGSAVLKEWQND